MSSVIPLDSQGRIEVDVPCRGCGYNLRGLAPGGACPECGANIPALSDDLRFSDPQWLEQLASSTAWLVAGIPVMILGVTAIAFLAHPLTEFVVMGLLWGAITLVGFWKLSAPEPGPAPAEAGLTLRRLVRWAAVGCFAAGLVDPIPALQDTTAGTVATTVSMLVALVLTMSGLFYARRLALRVPDRALALHAAINAWGSGLCVLLVAVAVILETVSSAGVPTPAAVPTPGGAAMTPAGTSLSLVIIGGACAGGVGLFAFGIWWIVLLLRYRRAFLRAAGAARTARAHP